MLLQEVPYSRIKVAKCKLTQNLLPIYCGNYDHQTIITTDIWWNSPIPIRPEECVRYHHDKEYIIRTQTEKGVFEDKVFAI